MNDPATGQAVPRGQVGEFCTRGYSVMIGYWNDPTTTAEAIDADGWIHTGDLAVMDDDGYVRVTGRTKDMVSGRGVSDDGHRQGPQGRDAPPGRRLPGETAIMSRQLTGRENGGMVMAS